VKTRLHRARRLLRDRLEDTLAAALTDSFPFDGARCSTMSERVLKRLGLE
jgi:RNA polymerase sigma-70 factor (ECF subfamily)